jgi:hypothetical protein
MKLKMFALTIALASVGLLGFIGVGVALGQFATIPIIISNTLGTTQTSAQVGANLSSANMIESGLIDADALDTEVDTAYMPGTSLTRILACFDDLAADVTAECQSVTANDVVLPALATEVFEFAADNQFKTLWIDITTPAIADWTIEWQYYNGSSYVAFDGVVDGTDEFTEPGLDSISWTFPAAGLWPQATLHSIEGYWVRAEVTALTTITQDPLGGEVFYETGRWWVYVDSIGPTEQKEFTLDLGVTPDPKTFHHYFPHMDGLTVPDDATMEITGGDVIDIKGFFDMTAPVTGSEKRIMFKDTAIEIIIPVEGTIQVRVFENP